MGLGRRILGFMSLVGGQGLGFRVETLNPKPYTQNLNPKRIRFRVREAPGLVLGGSGFTVVWSLGSWFGV